MEPGWFTVCHLRISTLRFCGSPLTARSGECWIPKTVRAGQRWSFQVGHGQDGWTKETIRRELRSSTDRRHSRVVSSTSTSGSFATLGSSGSYAMPMVIYVLSGRKTRFQRRRVSRRGGMDTLPWGPDSHHFRLFRPCVVMEGPLLHGEIQDAYQT